MTLDWKLRPKVTQRSLAPGGPIVATNHCSHCTSLQLAAVSAELARRIDAVLSSYSPSRLSKINRLPDLKRYPNFAAQSSQRRVEFSSVD